MARPLLRPERPQEACLRFEWPLLRLREYRRLGPGLHTQEVPQAAKEGPQGAQKHHFALLRIRRAAQEGLIPTALTALSLAD